MMVCGLGLSHSIVVERKKIVSILGEWIGLLEQMNYYIGEFKMPLEEVCIQLKKQSRTVYAEFYEAIIEELQRKEELKFSRIWEKCSKDLIHRELMPKELLSLWDHVFDIYALDKEKQREEIASKIQGLIKLQKGLEEKYKQEHKLVLSLGFFASAFFCLIVL